MKKRNVVTACIRPRGRLGRPRFPLVILYVFLLPPSSLFASANEMPCECTKVPQEVMLASIPALEARVESRGDPNFHPSARVLEKELYELRSKESPENRAVLCLLLNFYLGEANDEDVLFEVIECGRDCLETLERYLKLRPCVPEEFEEIFQVEGTRIEVLKLAIEAIRAGDTIGAP